MMKIEISEKSYKILYSIILSISLIIGGVYAAKKNESKGLLIGIILGSNFLFFN